MAIEHDPHLSIEDKLPHMVEWCVKLNQCHLIIHTRWRHPSFNFRWTKAHDLLVNHCDLTQNKLKQIVGEANIVLRFQSKLLTSKLVWSGCWLCDDFRDGWQWFFSELDSAQVPLLIFSAGVGDIIDQLLKLRYNKSDNMKVVSNFMKFNEEVRPCDPCLSFWVNFEISWFCRIFVFGFRDV